MTSIRHLQLDAYPTSAGNKTMTSLHHGAFLISNPASESGTLETLPPTRGLTILNKQQLQKQKDLRFGKDDKVCLTANPFWRTCCQDWMMKAAKAPFSNSRISSPFV